ncbi:MAG: hypothetical protein QXU18_13885 [Thermoplasmatales archaeon]
MRFLGFNILEPLETISTMHSPELWRKAYSQVEIRKGIQNIRKQHRSSQGELLSPVTDKDGKLINVARHNGIEEAGHRWTRMHICRRIGRSETTREMGMYGALTAILSNVENVNYIGKVFSKIDFLEEFRFITKEELNAAENSYGRIHANLSYGKTENGNQFSMLL